MLLKLPKVFYIVRVNFEIFKHNEQQHFVRAS